MDMARIKGVAHDDGSFDITVTSADEQTTVTVTLERQQVSAMCKALARHLVRTES